MNEHFRNPLICHEKWYQLTKTESLGMLKEIVHFQTDISRSVWSFHVKFNQNVFWLVTTISELTDFFSESAIHFFSFFPDFYILPHQKLYITFSFMPFSFGHRFPT